VPYFHNVFTLPHDLNPLILYSERNQRALLRLLFDATASTLSTFGRQELGGQIGFTLVLHTWDQQLRAHFHLHGLIASGALSEDGSRWIAGGRRFLFRVRGLSKMFRGKYLDGLTALLERGELDLPPQLSHLSETIGRRRWLRSLRKKTVGGLQQSPLCRTTETDRLPGPLHTSRGDQQSPFAGLPGRPGPLYLPGPSGRGPAEGRRTPGRGVSSSLSSTHST
jgi:hypothetical protein